MQPSKHHQNIIKTSSKHHQLNMEGSVATNTQTIKNDQKVIKTSSKHHQNIIKDNQCASPVRRHGLAPLGRITVRNFPTDTGKYQKVIKRSSKGHQLVISWLSSFHENTLTIKTPSKPHQNIIKTSSKHHQNMISLMASTTRSGSSIVGCEPVPTISASLHI